MIILLAACTHPPTPVPVGPNAVGPDGGTVVLGEVALEIPPGALDETVAIEIVDLGVEPPDPYRGLSTLWSFEPEGLVFAEPVTVTLPYEEHPLPPQLFWSEGDGYEPLEGVLFDEGLATATIEHFSTAFVAVQPVVVHEEPYQPPAVDILFVVDNSCSMFVFQQQLGSQWPTMFDALVDGGFDFHVGVVNTDMVDMQHGQGKLRNVGGQSYIEPSTSDPMSVFSLMVNMGTSGFYDEKGRAAAYTMVELTPDIPRNSGFYRADATLDLVFVSDEEDQSGGNPVSEESFLTWMDELKSIPSMTRAHAVVQAPGAVCNPQGGPGSAYLRYAQETGGEAIDICGDDWDAPLASVAQARLGEGSIELPVEPAEILSVRLEGVSNVDLLPTDYLLDGAFVRFGTGFLPVVGDTVIVTYRP